MVAKSRFTPETSVWILPASEPSRHSAVERIIALEESLRLSFQDLSRRFKVEVRIGSVLSFS